MQGLPTIDSAQSSEIRTAISVCKIYQIAQIRELTEVSVNSGASRARHIGWI